jgi:hypothetical protein
MQNHATVGRVLLASLHQAIAEVLPERLEFYERWLTPPPDAKGLGVASFMAMLSFLQREEGAADAVTARAGQYAAVRALRDLHVLQRAYLRVLPRRLRARRAIRLLVRELPSLYPETQIDTIRRRGTIFVGIEESPFCIAQRPSDRPSCSFYASTITTFQQLLDVRPAVRVSRCRSAGSKSCLLMVLPFQPRTGAERVILDLADEFVATPPSESVPETAAALAIEAPTEAAPESETALAAAEPTEPASPAEIVPTVEAASEDADVAPPVETPPQAETVPPAETQPELPLSPPEASQAGRSEAPASHPEERLAAPPEPAAGAPTGLHARWAAIAAKRTTPRRPVNVERLFAQATRPDEDREAPWHRL